LQALLKAGSHEVTSFRRWTRPLAIGKGALRAVAGCALGLLDRATHPRGRDGWTLERIDAFGPELAGCLAAAARSYRIIPVRDAAWLAWRYLAGPSRTQVPYAVKRAGELVGFAVLEMRGGLGVVVDVGVPADRESLDATIELLLGEARAHGCDTLDVSLTEDAPIVPRLRHRGFVGREQHGFQVAIAGEDRQLTALVDPTAWTFTDGDKDMDTVFSPELDR
jgi:hypothetical protein